MPAILMVGALVSSASGPSVPTVPPSGPFLITRSGAFIRIRVGGYLKVR